MTANIFTSGNPIYAGFLIAALILIGIEVIQERRRVGMHGFAWWALGGLTLINLLGLLYFWINRISVEMALTGGEQSAVAILQHALRGEPIYRLWYDSDPLTTPPLFQILSIPFAFVFGANIGTLRLVSVLGIIASGLIVFRAVTEKTNSSWWGMVGLGLFATAVGMMDSYMGTASPAPWLLCCALLGTYLIDRNHSESDIMLGILVLSNAVWIQQAGILFLIGALAYLTWNRGWAVAAHYWLMGVALTVLAWVTIGPLLFGDQFLSLTVLTPLKNLDFSFSGLSRYGLFVSGTYPLLALASSALVIGGLLWERNKFDIWQAQFVAAVLLGLLTTLFVPGGATMLTLTSVWFIVIGLQALYQWSNQIVIAQQYQLHLAALFASFVVAFRA